MKKKCPKILPMKLLVWRTIGAGALTVLNIGCFSFGDCCGGVHQCSSFLVNHANHLSTFLEVEPSRISPEFEGWIFGVLTHLSPNAPSRSTNQLMLSGCCLMQMSIGTFLLCVVLLHCFFFCCIVFFLFLKRKKSFVSVFPESKCNMP